MNIVQNKQRGLYRLGKLISLGAVICTVQGTFISVNALAQNNNENSASVEQVVEGRQFSTKTGKIVLAAQKLINDGQYGEAIKLLNTALALPKLTKYERSVIYQLVGSCHYESSQYMAAVQAYEAAIRSGGFTAEEASLLRVNIAQLLIVDGQAVRGAQMLEKWHDDGGLMKPEYVEMLWQAWSRAEQYERALPWAERWYQEAKIKERKHYDVLNFLYNHLQMPAKQSDVVKKMINRWPEDKTLWQAWKSLLANGGREAESFAVTKIMYLAGALDTQQEIELVVQYYGYYEMPYEAAKILEREMNAGSIPKTPEKLVQLANLYRQAREYKLAIPVLERAAKASGTGKIYADLGEALYKENQCDKAEVAFLKAMERGYDKGKSWMLIASCRYDDAATENRISCDMTDAQISASPWMVKRDKAMKAYDQVPLSSREAQNARTWKIFIRAEKHASQRRCNFGVDVKKDRCNIMIKQAYANIIFVGDFRLDDQTCMVYKSDYDLKYR